MSSLRCDVPGCGMASPEVKMSDGTEIDTHLNMKRTAVALLATCPHHQNWIFSEDARKFTQEPEYQKRLSAGKVAAPAPSTQKKS